MFDLVILVAVAYLVVRAVLNDRADGRDILGRPKGGRSGGADQPPKQQN